MSKSPSLISALFLAGLTASAHSALAQTSAQAGASAPVKKGPLGGLLEPWDGKGDEITPKTIHLGGVFEPWHTTDTKAKPEASATEPAAKKKGPLSGLLQPWGDKSDDKPTVVAKVDAPTAKKKDSLLQSWDDKEDAKPIAVATADEPVATKKTSGVLQPWDDKAKPTTVAKADEPAAKKKGRLGGLFQARDDKHDDKATDVAKADEPVVKKKGPLGGLLQPWDSASDKP